MQPAHSREAGNKQSVAVIIPTFKEAESIGAVIAEMPRAVIDRIIVADGGSSDGTLQRARDAGAEVIAVGRAKGVRLPDDFFAERMRFAEASPPGFKASLLHDLERGNRLEVDWLAGRVVALGRELGVPVPINTAIYTVLKPHRMGRGG